MNTTILLNQRIIYTALIASLTLFSAQVYGQCSANAGPDLTICAGQSITIGGTPTASGGTGPYTYDWDLLSGAGDVANPSITPIGTTTYIITIYDSNSCSASDQVTVTVNPLPVANGGPDLTKCLNTPSTQLPGGGTWTGSALVSTGGLFTPSAVGTYNLVLTVTSNGCQNTDQVTATVLPLPLANAGIDQTICAGQVVQLGATGTSPNGAITLYTWSGGPVSNSLSQNPTATPANTTTYNVTVVDVAGCSDPDQVTVFVNQLPAMNAGPDFALCTDSGPIQLTGFTPAGGTWSGTGVTAAGLFTQVGIGSYVLTYSYTNAAGCTNTDNLTVGVVAPGSVNAGTDNEICLNSAATLLNPATPGGTWSGSALVTAGGLFTPSIPGSHTLTYTLAMGACSASDQMVMTVNNLPLVNAGADAAVCMGQGTPISATVNGGEPPYSVGWSNGSSLSNPGILNPTANPAVTTTYTLTALDNNLCLSSDAVVITVNSLPVVNAGPDISLCSTTGPYQLSGFSPLGGTWSGSGTNASGLFTQSGPGNYGLTYTFTNLSGCTNTDNIIVTVVAPGVINAGSDTEACLNSNAFQLNAVSPGGTWSGSGLVTAVGVFTPSAVGSHILTYSVVSGACTSTDQVSVLVDPLPVVNAGIDVSLCIGSSVTLAASVSGGEPPYSIGWNNGASLSNSSILNPLANPIVGTTYTLTVQDNNTCSSSDAVQVSVDLLPVVNAGSDVVVCDQAIATQLTGYSPPGGIWSGSGVSSGGSFISPGIGSFVLDYTYTNGQGCVSNDQITVTSAAAPVINAGPDFSLCQNASTINLSAFTPSTGTWSGPGITNPALGTFNPSLVSAGIHWITLSSGTGSCIVSDQLSADVLSTPTVSAGLAEAACTNDDILLLSGSSPVGGSWTGTGIVNALTGAFDPSTGTGMYPVSYSYSDALSGCTSSASKNVSVNPSPSASMALASSACTGSGIPSTNSSTGATNYAWNYDNTVINGFEPLIVFMNAGLIDVQLVATSAMGCSDSASASIQVTESPIANFTTSEPGGCAPLNLSFSNNSTGDNITYSWDLVNWSGTTTLPPDQVYLENGGITSYDLMLTVSNLCGSDSQTQTILVDPRPEAHFDAMITGTVCSPVNVSFDNLSVGNPDNCFWDFGNGQSSGMNNPTEVVYTTGSTSSTFEVMLTVDNECGVDSIWQDIVVQPNLVHAQFIPSITEGCTPLDIQITNTSAGATHLVYDFGGLATLEENEPSFVFDTEGVYNVYLYADDGCGFDTTDVAIVVWQSPDLSSSVSDLDLCQGESFSYQSTEEAGLTYSWSFGDGSLENMSSGDYQYSLPGNFVSVADVTTTHGCSDSLEFFLSVHDIPQVQFTTDGTTYCSGEQICTNNGSVGASSYSWLLSSGDLSDLASPCFTSENTGGSPSDLTLQLTAENNFGCTDSADLTVVISPIPDAGFQLSSQESCDLPAEVSAQAIQNNVSWQWTLNGLNMGTNQESNYTFIQPGVYTIELGVENAFGCINTSTQDFTVYPSPVVGIDASPLSGCSTLPVNFSATGDSENVYSWEFGDGTGITGISPEHTYVLPGTYTVSITATNGFGCSTSEVLEDLIEVYDHPEADFTPSPGTTSIYYPEVLFTNESIGSIDQVWDFGDGGISSELEPVHSFTEPGLYSVLLTAWNEFGCMDLHTEDVHITNELNIFIPNSFSPNNDGLNDSFIPVFVNTGDIVQYDLRVFDRWGEAIFETTDPTEPWTGDVKSGAYFTNSAVYTYDLVIRLDKDIRQHYSGHITVLR